MVADVQSKLRLGLGSVKDHFYPPAMIYNHHGQGFSDIEIAVLLATVHDNGPIQDKHTHEILFLVSKLPFLAERISCRLCKTRDRVVAFKMLLIHRLLRGGNWGFDQELRSACVSGHLQMHWFQRSSNPSLCFLHKHAAYLEERIRRVINQAEKLEPVMSRGLKSVSFGGEGKSVLDLVFQKLPIFQAFIDRVLGCSPFDVFPSDNLAVAAMCNTLKESFQVSFKFSEAVETLINMFFDLTMPARAFTCEILKRASQQCQGLHDFYEKCKQIIKNKNLDYPCTGYHDGSNSGIGAVAEHHDIELLCFRCHFSNFGL